MLDRLSTLLRTEKVAALLTGAGNPAELWQALQIMDSVYLEASGGAKMEGEHGHVRSPR